MLRPAQHLTRRPSSHDFAPVQHDGPLAQLGTERQVVGDEDQRPPATISDSRVTTSLCTLTSRAEVGSSAISAAGRDTAATAIATRWRWPPERVSGNRLNVCSGSSKRIDISTSIAR